MPNFLINLFGCLAEVLMLRFFYTKLLGYPAKKKYIDYITYAFLLVYGMWFAIYIPVPYLRTLCAMIAALIPLYLYQYHFKVKLLYAMIFLSVQVLSELLVQAVSLLPESILPFAIGYTQGVILSKSLAILLIFIFVSQLHIRETKLPHYLTTSLLCIPAMSIFLIYALQNVFAALNTPLASVYYLLMVLLLVCANYILFFLFEKSTELHWTKEKLLVQETLLQEQKQYYEKSVSMFQENRRLSHDFKNHLITLNSYIQNKQTEQAKAYIAELTHTVQTNSIPYSGCSAVDAVLSAKQQLAIAQSTELNLIEMRLPAHTNNIERELALILATALDNALESTQKIPVADNRWINILIRYHASYLYLQIENATNEPVEIKNNCIVSTKHPPVEHGIGLSTIQKTVTACNGTLRLAYADSVFSLTVLLSCNKQGLDQTEAFV